MDAKTVTCIGCPLGCTVTVAFDQKNNIAAVCGNTCPRGEIYARNEVTHPRRVVTSTVGVYGRQEERISVKTESDIPKEKIFACMAIIRKTQVKAPVAVGDIIIENVCDTGVNVIATKDIA